MLGVFDDIEVVGDFENGQLAFDFIKKESVDLVLLDIRMPVMDGVETMKNIHNHNVNVKALILTTFTDHEYIYSCMEYGADGYILKSRGIKEIYKAIQSVMAGQVVLDNTVKSSILEKPKVLDKHLVELTEKEFNILKCVGTGLNNKEISKELFISEGTVRNYISLLLDKLDLRDRTQLAIYYVRSYEN
jgi:DNA-binding NarL/FixJ family response regulator